MKQLNIKNATAGTVDAFDDLRVRLGLERGELLRRLIIMWMRATPTERDGVCLSLPPTKFLESSQEKKS